MDDVVKSLILSLSFGPGKSGTSYPRRSGSRRPHAARWAGDDPDREGPASTRRRASSRLMRNFSPAIGRTPTSVLARVFDEVDGYDDIVLVRDIPFFSHCEHHMVPFFGKAHIAYYPRRRRRRPVEAGAARRHLRAAPADPGGADRADRRRDRPALCAARRRRDDRGRAHLHVDARRAETRRRDRHDPVHRRLPRATRRADALSHLAARRAVTHVPAEKRPKKNASRGRRRLHAALRAPGLIVCVDVDAASGEVLMVALYERGGARQNHRDRRSALLVALAPKAVAQGRDFGPTAARSRPLCRLRSGRNSARSRTRRRWRSLPHRTQILLL